MTDNESSLPKKGPYLVMALAVLVLFITGWQSYRAINTMVSTEARVSETKNILRAITDTFSEVQTVELGFRAYLVTGKEEYLAPYRVAVETLESRLSQLTSLKPEQPEQRARIEHLDGLIRQRLDNISTVVSDIDNLYEAKLAFNEELSGKDQVLTEIRSLIGEMEDSEYLLLQEQALAARIARERVFVSLNITIFIASATLFTTFLLFYYMMRNKETEKLKLESLVEQRTEELQVLLTELERSNQELQDFAFVASHDLQEPLRKIRAFSDRLQSKFGDELGDGKDYLDRMHSAAERMSRLIEDLLEYSRVSTRGKPFQPVALNDVVNDVLQTLELGISEKQAQIDVGELPVIDADGAQLRQLFQNIIGNALKFVADDKHPAINISADLIKEPDTPDTDTCEIRISDNGIGFNMEYLDKIFTPFKRLHPKSRYTGTGIGMAICKKIVERHGGSITATSVPDQGTTFVVSLPVNQESILEVDSINPQEIGESTHG